MSTSRQEQSDVAPQAVPGGFTPRCAKCQYELVGLPDGACPECGAGFSHEALKAEYAIERAHLGVSMDVIKPAAWMTLVVVIGSVSGAGSSREGDFGVLWVVCAGVLFALRTVLFRSRLITLALIGAAAMAVTISFDPGPWRRAVEVHGHEFLLYLFVSSAALCATALVRLKWRWVLWAWASLLIGIGAGVGIPGLYGASLGRQWSDWPDVRSGDPFSQYPLTNMESAGGSSPLILVGLLVMLLVRRIEPFTMEDPQADRRAS